MSKNDIQSGSGSKKSHKSSGSESKNPDPEQHWFEVAGIRIGTLRTYPVVKSRENQDGREIKKTLPFYLSVLRCSER